MRASASFVRGNGRRSGWYAPRHVDHARCSETSAGSIAVREPAESAKVRRVRRRVRGERQRHAVQAHRVAFPDRVEPAQPRPAVDQVVLGMHLEPEPRRRAVSRLVVVLGLESQPGGEEWGHVGSVPSRAQPLTGASEPMPFGVLMDVHVPFGTCFQALPW